MGTGTHILRRCWYFRLDFNLIIGYNRSMYSKCLWSCIEFFDPTLHTYWDRKYFGLSCKKDAMKSWYVATSKKVNFKNQVLLFLNGHKHGLRMPGEEIVFTAWPKMNSHSQIFRYGRSLYCLPHQSKFSDFFDLCLHWVSVVCG